MLWADAVLSHRVAVDFCYDSQTWISRYPTNYLLNTMSALDDSYLYFIRPLCGNQTTEIVWRSHFIPDLTADLCILYTSMALKGKVCLSFSSQCVRHVSSLLDEPES